MNRKSLCVLIGLSLAAAATSAQAQDFDDRWYFAPWIGYYDNDSDRNTDDGSLYGSLGIGRFIAPNSAIDVFVDHTSRTRKPQPPFESGWDNTGIGVSLRQHFGAEGWRPYIMGGIGVSHHDVGDDGTINSTKGWDPFVQAGLGLTYDWTENVDFRTEIAYRLDFDDESDPAHDDYGDFMLNLGLAVMLGGAPEPVAVVEEEVAETPVADCSTLDDDKDGVNNCDDKCPGTPSGQIVGPDGCPQDVVIDLRGVEFKFDRPDQGETDIGPTLKEPSSEGIAILDQAVDVLNRYPQVRVEVAGHTDSVGTEEYNEGLSMRRATIVYDYLTSKGVDAGRLVGPNGYGELRPIDTNDTSEGRQRNRRTELVIQK